MHSSAEREVAAGDGGTRPPGRNLHRHAFAIDKRLRAEIKAQSPCVVWFTGLSASGKSTIADLVERRLHGLGYHTYLLDGDNVREGLNSDLGFSDGDRAENIRRVAEVARLMVDAGLIVLVAFISPCRAERLRARSLFAHGEFVEVYVNAPLTVAAQRDPKGLYAKARRGELTQFTGIDSPYEPPDHPELEIRTAECTPIDASTRVIEALQGLDLLGTDAVAQLRRREARR